MSCSVIKSDGLFWSWKKRRISPTTEWGIFTVGFVWAFFSQLHCFRTINFSVSAAPQFIILFHFPSDSAPDILISTSNQRKGWTFVSSCIRISLWDAAGFWATFFTQSRSDLTYFLLNLLISYLQLRTFPEAPAEITFDELTSGPFLHNVLQTLWVKHSSF